MGKCGEKPYQFSVAELADLHIGDTKEMMKGCTTTSNAGAEGWLNRRAPGGSFYPKNGEFEWGGLGGNCGLCSDVEHGYGCRCSGKDAVIGKRGKVKRKAFLASKDQCCLDNAKGNSTSMIVNGLTCDITHRNPGTSECASIYKNACGGDQIITNQTCRNVRFGNADAYNDMMDTYCNLSDINAQKNECIDWCKQNSTRCTRFNTLQDCQERDMEGADCTTENVASLSADCTKYGIFSEQGMPVGDYQCTMSGLAALKDDCEYYSLVGEKCRAVSVENAAIAKRAEEANQAALAQSSAQFEESQNVLNTALTDAGLGDKVDDDKIFGLNTQMFIILVVIFVCLLLTSSIGSAGFIFVM